MPSKETQAPDSAEKVSPILAGIIFLLLIAILIFGVIIVKSVFFGPKVPQTAVERDVLKYEAEVKANPRDAEAYTNLGFAYFRLGKNEEAIKELRKAIKLDPKSATPHYYLALLYQAQGNIEKAIGELNLVVKLNPRHELAYFCLGKIYFDRKEYDKAVEAFKKSIEISPVTADTHYYLGMTYEMMGYKELAIKEYQEVLKYLPDHEKAGQALRRLREGK